MEDDALLPENATLVQPGSKAAARQRRNILDDLDVSIESVSLSLSARLSLGAWRRIGEQLHTVSNSSAWWIGDWLLYGQEKFPDRYRNAVEETSLDYQTLRNYAWVAKRFPPARRRPMLSFHHHAEVAALSAAEQDHWLDFAEKLGWSRNQLRQQTRASTRVDREIDRAKAPVHMSLDLEPTKIAAWQDAARKNERTLTEWIIVVLDRAAESEPED